jgi:hypothetical protein
MVVIKIDDDPVNSDWLHQPKKKKTKESMEPFKPQDGDRLQNPRVEVTSSHQGHERASGKAMTPRGFGDHKKEWRNKRPKP